MRTLTLALVAGGIAVALYKLGQQAPRQETLALDGVDAGIDRAMSGLGEHEDLLSPSTASDRQSVGTTSTGLPNF